MPRILDQVRDDLNPSTLGAITASDLSIWKTAEGVLFVDGTLCAPNLSAGTSVTFGCSARYEERYRHC